MRDLLLAAGLTLMAAPGLPAQSRPVLGPGARVRILSTGEPGSLEQRTEGVVERMSGDTLFLSRKIGEPRGIFVGHPETELYVSAGRRSSAGKGAVIGGILGIVAGGFYGLVKGRACADNLSPCFRRDPASIVPGLVLGGIGIGTGLIIGVASSHEAWQSTPPPSAGIALGLSVAF